MRKQSAVALAVAAFALASCAEDSVLLPPSTSTGPVLAGTAPLTPTTGAPATATSAPATTTALPHTGAPATLPEDVQTRGLTVLYAGHSFGRPFAENVNDGTRLAGIVGHQQRVVFRGGENGAPQAMWGNPTVQTLIKDQLDDGAVDVVVLICCSNEFLETAGQNDQAILEIVAYALERNPETRFGLAMPWVDFPKDYATADEHRAVTDAVYPQYRRLADRVSAASGGADVFTFYHGAAVYEIRDRFEQGLIPELTSLIGPASSSVFIDAKGHAASMAVDAGTLIWLNAIYGVDPLELPEIDRYGADIRDIAAAALADIP